MTTITHNEIRELIRRMLENSEQMQAANAHSPAFCFAWRSATNTYAIELQRLIGAFNSVTTSAQPVEPNPIEPNAPCIDCGEACGDPSRDPLRCVVCQLDAEDCQLCEQEAELEPGTFTPHQHGSELATACECGHAPSKHAWTMRSMICFPEPTASKSRVTGAGPCIECQCAGFVRLDPN